MSFSIRLCVLAFACLLLLPLGGLQAEPAAPQESKSGPVIQVWKRDSCGCCNKWIEHLRAHGFQVKAQSVASLSEVKRRFSLPSKLGSCHTGLVEGYVIEGHVPAADIKRLLKDKPKIKGLAVPGMPLGSPGMEQADGTKEPYEVLSFDEAGKTKVFAKH